MKEIISGKHEVKMDKINRRDFLRGIAGGIATGATMYLGACGNSQSSTPSTQPPSIPPTSSTPNVEWRLATSWTKVLDVLNGTASLLSKRVATMTEGHFQINIFPAGEIMAALDVFDGVQKRTIECCHTVSFYFIDKNESLAFATGVPFGLTAQQQNAWLYHGGGLQAIQEVFSEFGMIHFVVGNTGTQMGGWFKREINTLDDLKGLKFRIPGLGAKVMQRLGVQTILMPADKIQQAFEKGEIDGAEWVGPYDDEKLGLHKVAPYYYYPGWWEPCASSSLLINQQAWNELPPRYQEVLKTAAAEANLTSLTKYEMFNQTALARLVASGTQLRAYSEDILQAAKKAAFELYEETARANPSFRKMFDSWKEFRKNIYQWGRFNELHYAQFVTQSAM